jgi:hypothetical protein
MFRTEFLALQNELLRLSKTTERLSQAAYVPVSAHIKFKLTGSTQVLEHADAQFQQLADRAAGHLTFYQTKVMDELFKLKELEQNLAYDALNLHFCKYVGTLGRLQLIHHCFYHQSSD